VENELKNHEISAPALLADDQVAQVSGGLPSLLLGGCPTCASGFSTSFQNFAAIVNPAVGAAVKVQNIGVSF
jgi:hypothetical protein